MKELQSIRQELDQLDSELVRLFERRMVLSREVAAYKMAHDLPVLDDSREKQVLATRAAMLTDAHWEAAVRALYERIMSLSRAEQESMLKEAQRDA